MINPQSGQPQFNLVLGVNNIVMDTMNYGLTETFVMWCYICSYIFLGLGLTVICGMTAREDLRLNILSVTRSTNVIIPATHHHASGHGQIARNEAVTANSYL